MARDLVRYVHFVGLFPGVFVSHNHPRSFRAAAGGEANDMGAGRPRGVE
jgi:hypothetical protein